MIKVALHIFSRNILKQVKHNELLKNRIKYCFFFQRTFSKTLTTYGANFSFIISYMFYSILITWTSGTLNVDVVIQSFIRYNNYQLEFQGSHTWSSTIIHSMRFLTWHTWQTIPTYFDELPLQTSQQICLLHCISPSIREKLLEIFSHTHQPANKYHK